MQASSIAIIDAGVIPCMRIMARIMVLHISAQFMQAGAQSMGWPSIICTEQTVHACSQAEQASMHAWAAACIAAMSPSGMPCIDIMSFDMASIIMASIALPTLCRCGPESPVVRHEPRSSRRRGSACGHGRPITPAATGIGRLDQVLSSGIHRRLIAVLGVLTGLFVATIASPAFAHDELLSTDPASGSVLESPPETLTLTFSGVLLSGDGTTDVVVTGADGADLTAGEPVLDGVRVTQPLEGSASGTVTVAWRVVSSDGHPISGEFAFAVGEDTSPATPAPSPAAGAGGELLPVWIGVGVIVVAGGVIALLLTRRRPSHED